MPLLYRFPSLTFALTVTAAAVGCGGEDVTVPPTTGTLEITTSTSGAEPDADGFSVQIDAGPARAIGPAETLATPDITPGDHAVQLAEMAANCTVSGDNPRTVSVTAGETATVAFAVTCNATSGSLSVTAVTSGPPDPDGYTISIDGTDRGALGVNGAVTISGLTLGSHAVGLSGVAANCQIQGDNVQAVTLAAGANASVAYTIACVAPPADAGSIRVTTVTTGLSLDLDGYTVSVDGATPQAIGVNADLTISSVAPGDRSVTLASLASNCSVGGTNPRMVAVSAGSEAPVTFTVTCTAAWRSIPLPPDFVGSALWASSPSDLFVVGRYQSAPLTDPRVLVHYDGHDWTEQLRGENGLAGPVAVWGSSPTNVFAAGEEHVWQYDGTRWLPFHEGSGGDFLQYVSIWGASARDLFVVGYFVEAENEGPIIGLSDHYDGATWSQTIWTSVANGGNQAFVDLHDVGGSSPTDVYALATHASYYYDDQGGLAGIGDVDNAVWHNDGSGWRVSYNIVAPPTANWTWTDLLTAVWANAKDDVFVVGLEGRILHFNGTAWSPMTSPTTQNLNDVWGNAGSNVYAVGDGGILRYDGTNWTVINATGGTRVWGAGADVFVIRKDGSAILHGTP